MLKKLIVVLLFMVQVYGDYKPGDPSAWAYWDAYCEQIAIGASFYKKTNFNVEKKNCLCKEAGYKKHCTGKSSKK